MLFIAKHCAEISPRCFQMYSAPRSASLCSASSLCLVFQIYPVAFCTRGSSILLHPFPGSPAQPGRCTSIGKAAAASLGARAPTVSGGRRSPWDGRAVPALDVTGAMSVVTGQPRLLLATLPGCSSSALRWKNAKSSKSGRRNEARCLKCAVKSFSQGSCILLT